MRIVSVELHNIKSYANHECSIEFRPGVNLIWGENGSGKTTILEAIGFALFGALDLDLKQFRRKGEKEGEVILTLEGLDERYYQVVRKVRASASIEIRDVETNTKISKTREDAERWLSQSIGVEFAGYGKTLFENVLGVSQGRMVESFSQTAGVRKNIFEPILKMEGYQQAWDYLGKVQGELVGQLTNAKTVAARLEGQLSALPDLCSDLEDLDGQIVLDETTFNDLSACLLEQEQTFNSLKRKKELLDELEAQVAAINSNIGIGKQEIANAKKLRDEFEEAARTLETSLAGYEAFQRAQEELAKLEVQRKERDQFNIELQDVEKYKVEISAQAENVRSQLEEVALAEEKIAELEPLVQQQKQIEKEIENKKREVDERERAIAEKDALFIKERNLGERLLATKLELARRKEVEAALHEKQAVKADLLTVIDALGKEVDELQQKLDQSNQDLIQLKLAEQSLTNLKDQLEDKESKLEYDRQTLSEIEKGLAKRVSLQESLDRKNQELEMQQSQLTTAQNDQENSIQQIALLKKRRGLLQQVEIAECPMCKKPLKEHEAAQIDAEFAEEIAILERKWSVAESEEKVADHEIQQINVMLIELKSQLGTLPVPSHKIQLEEAIAKREGEINKLLSEINEKRDLPRQVASQEAQVQVIRQHKKNLDTKRQLYNGERDQLDKEIAEQNHELATLAHPSQEQNLEAEIDDCKTELNDMDQLARSLNSVPDELHQAEEALGLLGNPVGEQNQQRGIASKRSALEKKQGELAGKLHNEDVRKANLLEKLEPFSNLDERLEEVSKYSEQNQLDYERYLTNKKTAGAFRRRELQLSQLIELQQDVENQMISIVQKRDEVKGEFDRSQYLSLEQAIQKNQGEKIALQTRLELRREQARTKQQQLERLLQTKKLSMCHGRSSPTRKIAESASVHTRRHSQGWSTNCSAARSGSLLQRDQSSANSAFMGLK